MKRRWEWPILDVIKDLRVDDWEAIGLGWFLIGFVVFLVGCGLSVDRQDQVRFDWSHPASYIGIAWLAPYALAFLGFIALSAWWLIPRLIPHRATEPVREDLRNRYR